MIFNLNKRLVKSNSCSFMSHGANFVGNLSFEGTLHLSGVLEGTVTSKVGTLHVHGEINGDIMTYNAIINGIVNGNVVTENELFLTSRAKVKGSITYQKMSIDDGALIDGEVLNAFHNLPLSAAL